MRGSPGPAATAATRTLDTVLINNGQGLECGWSTGTNSPAVFWARIVEPWQWHRHALRGQLPGHYRTGLEVRGFDRQSNSLLLHNIRDVFGQAWDNTWNWRTNDMDIRSNLLTSANPYHPGNGVWNPAMDGWRLGRFMSTPTNAPVGVGFANWANPQPMSAIFSGIPVRLSSFTVHPVTLTYGFETNGTLLASDTITFMPGETVKRIYPSGFDLAGISSIQAVLISADQGEITGVNSVTFQGIAPAPQIFCRLVANQMELGRIGEGIPLGLTSPSARQVTIAFLFETPETTLMSGTAIFQPGETTLWIEAPAFEWSDYDMVRVVVQSRLRDAHGCDQHLLRENSGVAVFTGGNTGGSERRLGMALP